MNVCSKTALAVRSPISFASKVLQRLFEKLFRLQERIAKAEAARVETEKILEQQQKQVDARKREMARRDEERARVKAEKHKILVHCHGVHASCVHRITCTACVTGQQRFSKALSTFADNVERRQKCNLRK